MKQINCRPVNLLVLGCLILLMPAVALSQGSKSKISKEDSLREELRRVNLVVNYAKGEADRLMYLLTAKEMALRSIELKDSIFQSLVAVQAYEFNKDHKGKAADIEIYRALYAALKKFNDPLLQTLAPEVNKTDRDVSTKTAAMADKLCSRMKRNMLLVEWNKFSLNTFRMSVPA